MRKIQTIKKIVDIGVVSVIRAENSEEAIKISNACIAGGIPAIEVTYTVPGATEVIETLKKEFSEKDLIIGAGTVLDAETARIAIMAGAEYIVSPGFDLATAKLCNRYQIPYMPGVATITEAITAMEAGADIIKLFPGSAFGPSYVKAIKGPLPQANIMPTGGVSIDNVADWIKAGVVAVGVGGDLTSPAKTGNYKEVEARAHAFVEAVRKARS